MKPVKMVLLSLTKKTGFCFANNSYLSELNNVTPKTISNSITNLKKNNYIRVEYHKEEINKYKRKIFMTDKVVWKINSGGIEKMLIPVWKIITTIII